jgi:hypothetical protein
MELLGIVSAGFDATDRLLIRFLHSSGRNGENGQKMGGSETVNQLIIGIKKADRSKKREVMYGIRIEPGAP